MATASTKTAGTTRGRRRPAKGDAGAALTTEQNAESGFQASQELSDNLQKVLVDLLELQLQGKQAHWNVVGTNFRDTHRQLDEIIDAAREFSDTVAERMRALHAVPDGRTDTIAETTSLPAFPAGEVSTTDTIDLITARLDAVVGTIRDVHDAIDEEDPAVMAASVSASALAAAAARIGWADTDAASDSGCASFVWPKVTSSGSGPSGKGASSASTSGL